MATQEERRAASRTAIINAARHLFGEVGFEATKVDDIAERAGVAKGGVYHYFKNKHKIFEAVFDAVSADLVAAMIGDIQSDGDAIGMLIQSVQQFFDLCAEPHIGRILLQDGPAVLGHADWQRIDAQHFGGLVTTALSAAMEAEAIRKQPLESLSKVVLAGVQAAAIDCAARDDFDAAAKDYLKVFEEILRGLG
ncbi:MAG: TetR family transcriptional regulator [Rhodobiaceae bacterium]|nr:MAG: TetR family transcriptional regulator [Rhodobiaceae bacterium]